MHCAHPDTGRERGQDVVVGEGSSGLTVRVESPDSDCRAAACTRHQNVVCHPTVTALPWLPHCPAGSIPSPREKGQEQFLTNWELSSRCLSLFQCFTTLTWKNNNPTLFKCLFKNRNFLYLICAHGQLSFHWIARSLQHLPSQEFLHMAKIPLRWLFSRVNRPSPPKLSISSLALCWTLSSIILFLCAQHCSDDAPQLLPLSSASWSTNDQTGVMEGKHRPWFKLHSSTVTQQHPAYEHSPIYLPLPEGFKDHLQ